MALLGLLATLALHGGVAGIIYVRQVAAASAPPAPAEKYVVARLVRLGKKRDPKRLPQKVVPPPPTEKPETVSYDAAADDPPPRRDKPRPKQRDAQVSDRMRRALERAALLGEAQREIEAEGDPNGVAGGTATEASAGDPYITRIADIWNRTWTLPAIIPSDDAQGLQVLMVLRIDGEGNIRLPVEFDRGSGNPHFDASIKAAWARIRKIPAPPAGRRASILVNGLALKLTWKGLQ
jgi:hypothetical protein